MKAEINANAKLSENRTLIVRMLYEGVNVEEGSVGLLPGRVSFRPNAK